MQSPPGGTLQSPGLHLAHQLCLAPRLSVAHRSVCRVELPRFAGRPGAEPGAAQAQVEVRAEPIAFFQRNSSTFIDELNSAGCPTLRCLKPAISGNQSAASGDTNVKTAAGTSPLISRSIALV